MLNDRKSYMIISGGTLARETSIREVNRGCAITHPVFVSLRRGVRHSQTRKLGERGKAGGLQAATTWRATGGRGKRVNGSLPQAFCRRSNAPKSIDFEAERKRTPTGKLA